MGFVEIDGEWVRTAGFGAGDRTLVALGGAPAGFERWLSAFEALSRSWHVIGVDPRGIDQSKVFPPEAVTLDTMVADVIGAMDHAGVEQAVVAGEGLSGRVAVAAATAHPTRIRGCVTVSMPAIGAGGWDLDRFAGDYLAEVRTHAERTIADPAAEHLRTWMRNMWLRTDPTSAARVCGLLATASPVLDDVACPALVVHGATDDLVSVGEAQAVGERLRDADIVLLDGVGAAPLLTAPDRVAAAIDARFAEV